MPVYSQDCDNCQIKKYLEELEGIDQEFEEFIDVFCNYGLVNNPSDLEDSKWYVMEGEEEDNEKDCKLIDLEEVIDFYFKNKDEL